MGAYFYLIIFISFVFIATQVPTTAVYTFFTNVYLVIGYYVLVGLFQVVVNVILDLICWQSTNTSSQ